MEHMQTTETPYNKLAKQAKCAHEGCSCTVSSDEEFCSDYCSAQAGSDESDHDAEALRAAGSGGCGCGHRECASAERTLPPDAAGRALS